METEALRKEHERLENAINDLKSKIDLQNQEIHKYTNDISLAKVLELEYIEEVESLQKSKSSIEQDLKKEVKRVKDSLTNLQTCRQDELVQKSKIVETLKSQIKEHKRAVALKEKTVKHNGDVERETKRNSELKKEIDFVTTELEKIKESYDDLKLRNLDLNATQQLFKKKLDDLKTTLKVKCEEFSRIQGLMQDFQKTNFDNKVKLDSLKCKPLDPTKKGNSMFGEVEDSCVKLQQNLQRMKRYHSSIEEELKEDFEKIPQFIQDNASLKKSLEESKIYENEYHEELEKFLTTVPILETKIEEYKREILTECKFVAQQPSNFLQYINCRIKSLWKELIKAGDELNIASQEVLNTFKTLEDVNKNLRERKRQNLMLECTIDELDLVLLLLQIQRNMDLDEIRGIFKENFITEIIDSCKIEKKPLQENYVSNRMSINEHERNKSVEINRAANNEIIQDEIENSSLHLSLVDN